MADTTVENQLRLANVALNHRIAVLEDGLLEKDKNHKDLEETSVEALQDSEIRYRRLFESAQDGILILDAESGKVVDVNPYLLHLLGFSYEELCGQHIWELGVFKDIAASKDAFKILQDNQYIRYEDLPLETKKCQPLAVEFISNVYLVDQNKVIQCNIRDITARKRDEAERKRLLAAIGQAGEGIVMTDAQGHIEFVNPAFEQMTGYLR
ncbi:MAG: PAS domain S-box protein, partial [Desulfobulbaceae bacterium]|nr:PAS domain S-box protein [Desulfobulbaceae bacterium]